MRPANVRGASQALLNPFDVARNLVQSMLPMPDDPVRKTVEGMIRGRDLPGLAGLDGFQDREYPDSEVWSVVVKRQISALFKKNAAFTDDGTCTEAARKSFGRAEERCRITNRRLTWYYLHTDRLEPTMRGYLQAMEGHILDLIGSDTSDVLGAMPSLIRLTNGATEDRPRRRSLPFLKISAKLRGPRAVIPYLGNLLLEMGVDLASCTYTCVERNVLTLVPKNWKTHRTIAKEPTHSLPLQLAIDGWLKRKLQKWGVNLSSQEKNQELAREGSIDGSFATIDLEMASDTLAFEAVSWMLPPSWLKLLDDLRSTHFSAPWGDGTYAKFSSMGNGFTFTLETLIFAAACKAVGSRRFAVYGDDIVIEADLASELVRLLRFLGFRTNDAKSFINPQSRFRESCGCDYWKGHLITPFYLRECPKDSDLSGWSHVLNGLVAVTPPGPLWAWAKLQIKRLGLPLVPWNEDSRSGIFVTPGFCWSTKRLRMNRKQPTERDQNPQWGFPVFRGFAPKQVRRKTHGWRSCFLWFLMKQDPREQDSLRKVSSSSGGNLLELNRRDISNHDTATRTSEVGVRTRYTRKLCRYSPQPFATPSHLFLWTEVVGDLDPGSNKAR